MTEWSENFGYIARKFSTRIDLVLGFLFGINKQRENQGQENDHAASLKHRPEGAGDIQGHLQDLHYFSSTSLSGAWNGETFKSTISNKDLPSNHTLRWKYLDTWTTVKVRRKDHIASASC